MKLHIKNLQTGKFEEVQTIKGPKGDKGEKGEKGDRGTQGIQGPRGVPGSSGAVGPEGLRGPQGEQGIQGIQGIQGEIGPQGEAGASINRASFVLNDIVFTKDDATAVTLTGAKTTLTGPQGPQGEQGEIGPQGIQGEIGPKGDKGETGEVSLSQLNAGLDTKVDKIVGKGLSEADYTTIEKNKLATIAENAQPDQNAIDVPITDVGNHYNSTNVEDALQEVGANMLYLTDDEVDIPVYLAQDSDFEWVAYSVGYFVPSQGTTKGYYHYIGTELKLEIPHTINGDPIKSYYRMFMETSVIKVVSTNLNVTNMSNMFNGSQATTLDLSNLDISSVQNTGSMFRYAITTTGYARTQADADEFNASTYMPAGLVFTVKEG